MTTDYRAIDFLNNFDDETRKHIIEFGKKISSKDLESDVFLIMARKAICFVDFLCEVKLAHLNGIVVSDRILDMNTTWLEGKSVTVIDDALVSGTTLKKVINKLEKSGVSGVKVFVLSINKKWFNPDMLTDSEGQSYLTKPCYYNTNEKCMQMCYDIVKALSTIPRPYDMDFPLYGEYKIEEAKLNQMINSSWAVFNVTSTSHISNSYASSKTSPKSIKSEYESLTFVPSENIFKNLAVLTGINLENACVLKVRTYIKKRIRKTTQHSILFLPIAIFNEISTTDIEQIIEHFFETEAERHIIEQEMPTYESKFRLVQFIVAHFLMRLFFFEMNFNVKDICENITYSPIERRMKYVFTPKVVELIKKMFHNYFSYTKTLTITSPNLNIVASNDEINNERKNSLFIYDVLSSKFMELYRNKEISARTLAKKHGKAIFNLKQYANIMERLEKGYTYKELVNCLNNFNESSFVVSIFLDLAIDTGIAVPITYVKKQKVVRAYRHGEDVVFTDVEARQITYMLNCFLETTSRDSIPALLLEKLLTTFIRFGLHDNIFEKYDYKTIHSQERDFIKIAYYLHGTTAMVGNSKNIYNYKPILTSDSKEKWLKDILVSKKLLTETRGVREDLSVYHIEKDIVNKLVQEHNSIEAPGRCKVAKRIAQVIGYLYDKKIITETDLVLLNATFGHDQIIPALLAEVQVILDNSPFYKHVIQQNYDKSHAMNAIVSFRKNNLFTAQNSGYMKWESYVSDLPRKIIERVKNSNPGNVETEHFFDEFERYWEVKLSSVKEEVPNEINSLINYAAVFILQYGLLYRVIELMFFNKYIGEAVVYDYFSNLQKEIEDKSTTNKTQKSIIIKEYNNRKKKTAISAYFKLIKFNVNTKSIYNKQLIENVANATKLKDDINKYIQRLEKFSILKNILDYQQALEYARSVLSGKFVDVEAILLHLDNINHRAERFTAIGCKYINNRGEIEAPVEYPNIIVIDSCGYNVNKYLCDNIIKKVKERQKKLNNKKNEVELIFQCWEDKTLIMTRGYKSDEALVALAMHLECTLNTQKEVSIYTILDLNSACSPYRFTSCTTSANSMNFFGWYNDFKSELKKTNSHFIILSETTLSFKKEYTEQLEKTTLTSKAYADLSRKEFNIMYLKDGKDILKSPQKGLNIGIICAKENERAGIINAIKNNFKVDLQPKFDETENHRLIDVGTINRSGVLHKIILTKSEQGNTSSANAYASLVHFKPDYVFFVGIAGTCNPKEVNLGDVIIPSEIVDATLKKEKNDKMQLRASTYHIPGNHIGLMQLFVRVINERYTDFKVLNSKAISDNTVYACDDSQILKDILTFNDKIDGIEMEAAGIYLADYERNQTKYGVFTIRGISDNANHVKDDKFHSLAISNASQILCDLIEFLDSHFEMLQGM